MSREIDIAVEVDDSPIPEEKLLELFTLLEECPTHVIPTGDLSIALVDEATICQLHDEFLDDPSPTDVITFPGDSESDFAGEIVVSADQAVKEHAKHENSVAEEIVLYMVHGWLHLAGEDDLEDETRKSMRTAENAVLRWLEEREFSVG